MTTRAAPSTLLLPKLLALLLLLSLAERVRAVPTLRSPLSRGFFDFFTPTESMPQSTPSPSIADLTDTPLDSLPEDDVQPDDDEFFFVPSPSPVPSVTPLAALTPEPSATPLETEQPEVTPVPEQLSFEQVPEQTALPLPTFVLGTDVDPDQMLANDMDPLDPSKAVDPRSSATTQIASTASTGISVVALVAVAVAVLAPALLIYYGIRRRRAAGFNAMPPTVADTSTYRPASQFTVGE